MVTQAWSIGLTVRYTIRCLKVGIPHVYSGTYTKQKIRLTSQSTYTPRQVQLLLLVKTLTQVHHKVVANLRPNRSAMITTLKVQPNAVTKRSKRTPKRLTRLIVKVRWSQGRQELVAIGTWTRYSNRLWISANRSESSLQPTVKGKTSLRTRNPTAGTLLTM